MDRISGRFEAVKREGDDDDLLLWRYWVALGLMVVFNIMCFLALTGMTRL